MRRCHQQCHTTCPLGVEQLETATFGSEYVAARACTEQQIDLRNTFRYLGVPVHGPSFAFGDNESVVNTASVPHSKLGKRHNILSYHRTREAIAAGIIHFHWLKGDSNPADILSKEALGLRIDMVSAPSTVVLGWRYRRYRSVGPCQVLVGPQSKGLISRPTCRSPTTLLRGVTNTQLHPWVTSIFGRIWAGFGCPSTAGCLLQRPSQLANPLTFLKTSQRRHVYGILC